LYNTYQTLYVVYRMLYVVCRVMNDECRIGNGNQRSKKGKGFVIDYLLFTIDYFSVAQTTVLIGVNPCLTEGDLKKQTQFIKG